MASEASAPRDSKSASLEDARWRIDSEAPRIVRRWAERASEQHPARRRRGDLERLARGADAGRRRRSVSPVAAVAGRALRADHAGVRPGGMRTAYVRVHGTVRHRSRGGAAPRGVSRRPHRRRHRPGRSRPRRESRRMPCGIPGRTDASTAASLPPSYRRGAIEAAGAHGQGRRERRGGGRRRRRTVRASSSAASASCRRGRASLLLALRERGAARPDAHLQHARVSARSRRRSSPRRASFAK